MVKLKDKKILQSIRYFKRAFVAVYGSKTPNAEYIHDLRVYCRRLNAILHLLKAKELGKDHLVKILKQTGPVRDAYIYETIILPLDSTAVKESSWQKKWDPPKDIIKEHREVEVKLSSLRDSAKRKVDKRFNKTNNDVIARLVGLSARPSKNYLHKTRIRIKRLRYIHDVVEAPNERKMKLVHQLCREAQKNLGKLHDYQNVVATYEKTDAAKNHVLKKLRAKIRSLRKDSIVSLKRLLRALQRC